MTGSRYVMIALALLIVLAGCSGTGGGDATTTTQTTTAAPTTTGGAPTIGGDTNTEWVFFDFDQPATYEYDVYVRDQGSGTMRWDVTDVSDDQVTVHVVYDVGETSYKSTMTGTRETIRAQLFATPAGPLVATAMFMPGLWYQGQHMAVGNQWSSVTSEGSASFAVTGTDSYAGVDCYVTEMRFNETVQHRGCVSPDIGLAPHSAFYDEDGTLELEMTLTNYTRG